MQTALNITACRPVAAARPVSRAADVKVVASSKNHGRLSSQKETVLNASLAPMAVLAGINPLRSFLEGQAAYFATLDLPEPLVHWGHPGNMAVVLLAMGFYGCGYLGWQIRSGEDPEAVAKAVDLHPKLAIGMTIFFALGALGGSMSMLMQGKDMWSSSHVWTGVAGLTLLLLQAMLPLFFEEDPNARSAHAFLGSGILLLFLVHAGIGLQLGLSI